MKKTMDATEDESILEEAERIINGERADMYGSAEDSFAHIAGLWGVYLGMVLNPKDVAMMMILLKIARQRNKNKRDNLVDICGYAALAEKM